MLQARSEGGTGGTFPLLQIRGGTISETKKEEKEKLKIGNEKSKKG